MNQKNKILQNMSKIDMIIRYGRNDISSDDGSKQAIERRESNYK